ncbi:MAG: preprotein translocase subunit SecA [Candidatus Omnitrophica bacterium]|nr:preprotein translocase subunit SecA [Candidatus Omnitrophota bacterium]
MPIPSINVIKKHAHRASRINALETKISQLSDTELKAKTQEFKTRVQAALQAPRVKCDEIIAAYKVSDSHEDKERLGQELKQAQDDLGIVRAQVLDQILEEAFAVVREVGKRLMNMRHFDVQLIGGMVLHSGGIAEMTTGEGKTLVATLPAYLNALSGEGVHVITVNDYLARRDREWMGKIYEFLGLSVGVILHDMSPRDRQAAYHCDITYGTNNEFGFDYLRDNMVSFKEEMVQRDFHFAIVDEVDSILIDEARTPLIISGPAEESTDKYYTAAKIVPQLKGRRVTEQEEIDAKHRGEDLSLGYDYVAEEKGKTVAITEAGEEKAAKLFGVDNLHEMQTIEYRHQIINALRSKEFFRRDTDYVVKDGKVIIVDEFTGRMMPGRRWSDGLHQAVEAKEGIKIERENQTLATITFQNYFRMYQKLSGMTGTAYTEANEFKQIYKLDCVVIPTNRKLQRINSPDCIYKSTREKYNAVVAEIEQLHQKGQPVLVGTISIEKSELISSLLKAKGIAHQVLNAKYHEMEAHIIAQAGRYKAVTIATNMAGRGTDIVLGGNAEYLARNLAAQKLKGDEDPAAQQEIISKFIEQFRAQVKVEHDQVVQAGGLHVLGTERHESRRIDNQLRGRSGRQGDPGSSRFYVSLEDDLMRLFAGDRIISVMNTLGMEEGQAIESTLVSRSLETAQKRVENYNFEIRKQLIEYDNVMNKQREVIYNLRRSILEGDNIKDFITDSITKTADVIVEQYLNAPGQESADWAGLEEFLKTKFAYDLAPIKSQLETMPPQQAKELISSQLLLAYQDKEKELTTEQLRHLERMILLHVIDTKWKDHLYAMDHLKEGISLRALGQRDPLVEYKREGFKMFQVMYESIHQDLAEMILKLRMNSDEQKQKSVFATIPQRAVHSEFSGLTSASGASPAEASLESASVPKVSAAPARNPQQPKVGRNDPCPCGSGKKYKKCCGINV